MNRISLFQASSVGQSRAYVNSPFSKLSPGVVVHIFALVGPHGHRAALDKAIQIAIKGIRKDSQQSVLHFEDLADAGFLQRVSQAPYDDIRYFCC